MMNFTQAEQFLYSLNNLPRREYLKDPRQCSVFLRRLQWFLDILGNPEKKIPHYIHVTGTSGKGSVCAFLASILTASGKRVGITISPHPTVITERWCVGKTHMTQKEFCVIVETCKKALDTYIRTSPYDMISYFELTMAIGFLYFAQKQVDWAVIEVGCGGRYDASNVIPKKDIAIITTIGLDHVDILGPTKKHIAIEKAGIITPGCHVFTTVTAPSLLPIIQNESYKKKALLHLLRFSPRISYTLSSKGMEFTYEGKKFHLRAPGAHQIHNALLAREVALSLGIQEQHIHHGLAQTILPACVETVSTVPYIILDSAHNVDKMKATVDAICELRKSANMRIHLLLGFSDNKDITAMIKQLMTLKPRSVACTRNTANPFRKAASQSRIEALVKKISPHASTEVFLDPKDALLWSRKQMQHRDILLITGSLFVSGELRALFHTK